MAYEKNNQNQRGNAPAKPKLSLDLPPIAVENDISKGVWLALKNLHPAASDEALVMVWAYCTERKLDPLRKPVHVVPMYVKDSNGVGSLREVVMPGIQELRTTAARTGLYAGQEAPVYGPEIDVPVVVKAGSEGGRTIRVPSSCTITVLRLVAGKPAKWTHTELFGECVARTNDGVINTMWLKRPVGQMTKTAEAGALRKAFPEELGGVMSADEMIGRDVEDDEQPTSATDHGASGVPGPEEIAEPEAPPQPEVPAVAPSVATAVAQTQAALTPARAEVNAKIDDIETQAAAAADARREARLQSAAARMETPAEIDPASIPDPQPDAAQAPAPVASGSFKVDLPAGPLSLLQRELAKKGGNEAQLLAKMGEDITIKNINVALKFIKDWS